jgi:hypothetical protein
MSRNNASDEGHFNTLQITSPSLGPFIHIFFGSTNKARQWGQLHDLFGTCKEEWDFLR